MTETQFRYELSQKIYCIYLIVKSLVRFASNSISNKQIIRDLKPFPNGYHINLLSNNKYSIRGIEYSFDYSFVL